LTVHAPVAQVVQRWLTVPRGSSPRVPFDRTISRVSVGGRAVAASGASAPLPRASAGTIEVAAAARSWERLGPPVAVSWVPQADDPVVLTRPAAASRVSPLTPLRLTFSRPVTDILGS